ncbi:MAG: Rho termination factor N-terminal domain-containing protein [Actinobacteria bacterium]|nr:Rho termination factor N-terminal domain-containing protein [Actinomycetota bacterium]
MTKTELESKHLADLHQLAADAGVERYRLLTRAELIERLGDGDGDGDDSASGGGSAGSGGRGERPKRRRRRSTSGREREERIDVEEEEEEPRGGRPRTASAGEGQEEREDSGRAAETDSGKDSGDEDESPRPRRRRRRRRFGRRREGVTIQDLLLPAESGRQAVLLAEGREAATELLRSVAADLAAASDGPDPVALLIDPSPEELADWKREAPQAELVSAGQARHTSDALASAQRRAAEGEDVILLVDSLTRFADSFGDSDAAKELFDAGRAGAASGKGSLTVVVAVERS